MSTSSPRISVLITYGDPRQHPDHVATWTRDQTLPADRFEVLVVANRDSPHLDAIRTHLRPTDRLILRDGEERYQMYPAAVELARGDLLLFTEDHCLARARCLEVVVEHFERCQPDAASLAWGNINRSATAIMDDRASVIAFENSPWNRVHFRAFVIRKSVLQEAGGFPGAYGPFGESILAGKLHQAGRRIDLIEEPCVDHINAITFRSIFDDAYRTILGECEYITSHDRDFCDAYFNSAELIARYVPVIPGEVSAVAHALRQTLAQKRYLEARLLFREYRGLLARKVKGSWFARLAARWGLVAARLRFALGAVHDGLRFRGFWDYWRAAVDCARADFFAQTPPDRPAPGDFAVGLHRFESHQGIAFRWSPPVFTAPLQLDSGDHEIAIDTAAFRGDARSLPVWFFWNGTIVPQSRIRSDSRWIRVTLASEDPVRTQRLTVVTSPLDAPNDPRRLGLPIAQFVVTGILAGQNAA